VGTEACADGDEDGRGDEDDDVVVGQAEGKAKALELYKREHRGSLGFSTMRVESWSLWEAP
jgi:hypothetical protein